MSGTRRAAGLAPPIEESIARYLRTIRDRDEARRTEDCFEDLARYLVDASDLYADRRDLPREEPEPPDWEIELDDQTDGLFDHDDDRPALFELGDASVERIEPQHLREFFGWYLPREGVDAPTIERYARAIERWLDFLVAQGWRAPEERLALLDAVRECAPEAARCARAAAVLLQWARHGAGMPARLRGERFADFAEGHARFVRRIGDRAWFSFEDEYGDLGPVRLPRAALNEMRPGDVLDAEFGLRGDDWWLVDVGALYPGCVYVEVGEIGDGDKRF